MKNIYIIKSPTFNFIEARDGGLCVVHDGMAPQPIPCIVSSITLDDKCITRINGTEYIFNRDGSPSNTAAKDAGYSLYNGKISGNIGDLSIENGTVVENNTQKYTRAADGGLTEDTSDPYYQSVSLDSLDVRDQLAVQILSDILRQSGKNPAGFSGYEMGFYCDAAYEWASYFVKAAAQRKIIVEDADTGGGTSTRASVSTDSLSSNTEKLLNNIIVALEKTDLKEGDIYSERVVNPKLNSILEGLQETVGAKKYERVIIKDLDTFLAKVDLMNGYLNTMNTYLNAINTSIQGFTSTLNSRMNQLDQAISDAEDAVLEAMPSTSGLATSGEVQTAKDNIIAAMPTCKYTPTTNNTEE